MWPAVVEAALDKVSLYKALVTDRETSLYNCDYFQARLVKLMRASEVDPRPLKLWEDSNSTQLVLAVAEIQTKSGVKTDLKAASSAFSDINELLILARLSDRRLGAIFRAGPQEAKASLERIRTLSLERMPDLTIFYSYALFPQDLTMDLAAPFQSLKEAAALLLEKAETVLNFAVGRPKPAAVIGFGDLINSGGLVVQVLPQDRVLINLGRTMGALPGQVFKVIGEGGDPKGEITIFGIAETSSLAHVTGVRPGRLAAGDRLVFSRMDWAQSPGQEIETRIGYEREGFLKHLTRLTQSDGPLTLAMARLDDHERLATIAGQSEVDKRLDLLMSSALDSNISPELLVNWGPGTAALVWVGLTPTEAEKRASNLISGLKGQAPASIGLVHWPSTVIKPEDLIQAGLKSLVEAAMTGPEQVIVFGAQTLNISGDHLFDEGDLPGAIDEYLKGLATEPPLKNRLNLLNSIGVCYGRQGDQKAATKAFEEVIKLDEGNMMAYFNCGCSQLLSGLPEDAEKSFRRAAEISPDNFEVLYCLGKTALELGHFDRALEALNHASELKDRQGKVHRLLGQARLLAADRPGALTAFKKAVKYNPDDAESLSSLGALFLESANDQEVAMSLFQRSVELDPTNSLFRQRLGKLLFELGEYPSAKHHLKLALEYGCWSEDVRRQLASLSEAKNDPQVENSTENTNGVTANS
jgi:tetratricopeptide (TPR) repeat protein